LKPLPPPSPTPGQGGGMWGILCYLKAWFAHGGAGFLRICFTHSSRSGCEVGIELVPSFLTVILSCGHWCPSLDFDGLYCFCQKKQMIEVKPCDNPSCKFEWFHFQCVGLQEEEDLVGQWFCLSGTLARDAYRYPSHTCFMSMFWSVIIFGFCFS